jgi:hypothetical protein
VNAAMANTDANAIFFIFQFPLVKFKSLSTYNSIYHLV